MHESFIYLKFHYENDTKDFNLLCYAPIEHVENSIQKEEGKESYITRIELLKELQQLKECLVF